MIAAYIEVCRLDGNQRLVILKIRFPKEVALVVNPLRRRIYWAESGQSPRIASAWLDGSNNMTLANVSIAKPNALTVDYVTGDVYWVDSVIDSLQVRK